MLAFIFFASTGMQQWIFTLEEPIDDCKLKKYEEPLTNYQTKHLTEMGFSTLKKYKWQFMEHQKQIINQSQCKNDRNFPEYIRIQIFSKSKRRETPFHKTVAIIASPSNWDKIQSRATLPKKWPRPPRAEAWQGYLWWRPSSMREGKPSNHNFLPLSVYLR